MTMSDTGLVLLIIAPVGDLIIPFILAPFYNKYNHMTMVMSLLGNRNCPLHFIYNLWLVLAGVMFMIGSVKMYDIYSPFSKPLSLWLALIILLYAIGACILSGIFSVGETKELITISQKIHGYGAALGFSLLTFAPMIIGIIFIRSNQLLLGIVSLIFYVFGLLFFILFVMGDKERFAETLLSNEGLWQRLSMLCMYIPVVMIAYYNILFI